MLKTLNAKKNTTDGTVSKNLDYYLSSNEKTEAHYDGLSNSLYLLKDYLLQQRIITMTLKPKNISCQKNNSGIYRLFVVDNIGNSDFIPICNYSKYFAKKKISRKWQRFEDSMLIKYEHNKALHRMLTSSHRCAVLISFYNLYNCHQDSGE
jgi:PhoP regulatory network protein YrbL